MNNVAKPGMNTLTAPVTIAVETRIDMQQFVRAIRRRQPMTSADREDAMQRLREISRLNHGRVSCRAWQALADVNAALGHYAAGGSERTLPAMRVTSPFRPRR